MSRFADLIPVPPTTRGLRNKNPLNLEFNKKAFSSDPWVGELGIEEHASPRFTTFSQMDLGVRAGAGLVYNLFTGKAKSIEGPLTTITEIVGHHSPATDPTNPQGSTQSYIRRVAEYMGIDPNEPVDFRDDEVFKDLIIGMMKVELNNNLPDEKDIDRGLALAKRAFLKEEKKSEDDKVIKVDSNGEKISATK